LKRHLRSSIPATLLAICFAAQPTISSACAVCMGDPSSKTGGAINGAIFLMLGFLALMLGGIGFFIYHLARRAQAPVPPHVEIAQMGAASRASR